MEIRKLTQYIEQSTFGVCSRIGDRLGIASSSIRKYFIYASCFTFGSPVVVYFALLFWMNIKDHLKYSRKIFWK